jgi:hypothetical protein
MIGRKASVNGIPGHVRNTHDHPVRKTLDLAAFSQYPRLTSRPPGREEIYAVKIKLHSPSILSLIACLGFAFAPAGCAKDTPSADEETSTETGSGDGDGDTVGDGDGDGDTGPGDGDGDGDTGPGDGDGDTAGDGDGDTGECVPDDPNGLPMGATCTSDDECGSCNCYVVPFLGGQCGECNEDVDCADSTGGGCTPPNPFMSNGSTCNTGEAGGGCESTEVCMDGLTCGTVLDLLGLIQISTCGECMTDADCTDQICAPVVIVQDFNGQNTCIDQNSLGQDSFCNLTGNGNDACMSGICSTIDIMGLAQVGACGECNTDADCMGGGTCTAGEFILDTGTLVGSTCM